MRFDPNELTILLTIQTDQDDDFCPTSVEILLKSEVVYKLSMPEGNWHGIDKIIIKHPGKAVQKLGGLYISLSTLKVSYVVIMYHCCRQIFPKWALSTNSQKLCL